MSLLWNGGNKTKLLTNQMKPSPTYQHNHSDSARNSSISSDGSKCFLSVMRCFIEESSLFTFFLKKISAGMTVEASIVLPLFVILFLNLGSAMEMIRLHGNLQLSLWEIGSKLSLYGYVLESGEVPDEAGTEEAKEDDAWWKDLAGIAFSSTVIKAQLIESAGENYLNNSPLSSGTDSLWLWESTIFGSNDELDVILTYSVSPWSSLIEFPSFRMANRYYAHSWNGYRIPGTEGSVQTAFLAENASVYHLDRECSYLRLVVNPIAADEVWEARNQYGGRYRACEKCVGGTKPKILYIAAEGDCYHYDGACSGLKRTVYSVTIEEAKRYRACSRCGQNGQ